MGSIVARWDNQGFLHDMEVVGTGKPMKAMAAAVSVQAVGHEWTMVYLNRETGEKRESMDDGADWAK